MHHLKAKVNHPDIWDVAHPDYYDLIVSLYKGTELIEQEVQNVGFRTIELNPNQGFLLNGRKVKLNGVCDHHDLGCLGTAFHKRQ